jgi:hypothetical protein
LVRFQSLLFVSEGGLVPVKVHQSQKITVERLVLFQEDELGRPDAEDVNREIAASLRRTGWIR